MDAGSGRADRDAHGAGRSRGRQPRPRPSRRRDRHAAEAPHPGARRALSTRRPSRTSRSSGCGRRCGRSPARSTTSPSPVTTSSTGAAPTRCSSSEATTARCARSRTCAGTAATRCAPAPDPDYANCSAATTAGRGISQARSSECPTARGSARSGCPSFPSSRVRVDTWERLVFVNLDADAIPLQRLPGGGAERHRVVRARRLPLLRNDDHRGRRELEDDRRRVQRDVPHPDVAPRTAQVHGRRLCTAGDLGPHRQVRAALRRAESADQGGAHRRRCVGRLRHHAGRADGRRRGHPVPRRRASARTSRWPT